MHAAAALCILNFVIGSFAAPSALAEAEAEADPQIYLTSSGPHNPNQQQNHVQGYPYMPVALPLPASYPAPLPASYPASYPAPQPASYPALSYAAPQAAPEDSDTDDMNMFMGMLMALVKTMMTYAMPVMANLLVGEEDKAPFALFLTV